MAKHIWTESQAPDKRAADRREVSVPARLTWKDPHGTTRIATAVTRNVSDYGVYVECQPGVSISLYRLVQFQVEADMRTSEGLPEALRRGRILSAVYRVAPGAKLGTPQGLALRLMVEPKRNAATDVASTRATA